MFDAQHLRERATRLLAMALKAREGGNDDLAEDYTDEQHTFPGGPTIEGDLSRPESSVEIPALQQQQPQPDSDIDKE